MEWLKKHWGILAAIAVGIPVLIWLYNYQQTQAANNAANSAQDAQANQLEQEEAAQSQETALSDLLGGSSSGEASSVSSTPVSTTSTSNSTVANSSSISATAPVTVSGNQNPGTTADTNFGIQDYTNIDQVPAGDVPGETVNISGTGPGTGSFVNQAGNWVSTLLGASSPSSSPTVGTTPQGGSITPFTGQPQTQTTGQPLTGQTGTSGIVIPAGLTSHNSSGEIPQHNTLEPARANLGGV